jgi:hypothetical protein
MSTDSYQSVLLTLIVAAHDSVGELLQKAEGRERDEYALAALPLPLSELADLPLF